MVERLLHHSARLALASVGRLSEGVRIGLDQGFDSAASLAHGYQNHSAGRLGLGRLLDRAYLDQRGWLAIRQRGQHLQDMLADCLRRLSQQQPDTPLRVVDLGAGRAWHTLNAVAAAGCAGQATVTLIDEDADSLAHARDHAANLGLDSVQTLAGDAFDWPTVDTLPSSLDVAVVSGLYEWFEDAVVAASLSALYERTSPGGAILYTGHPWHPHAHWMDHVLPSRRGGTCRMTRRGSQQLDALIATAGYEKSDSRADAWGIFTVSLAVKQR